MKKMVLGVVVLCMLLLGGCGREDIISFTLKDGSTVNITLDKKSKYTVEQGETFGDIINKEGAKVLSVALYDLNYRSFFEPEELTDAAFGEYTGYTLYDLELSEVVVELPDNDSSLVFYTEVLTLEELIEEVNAVSINIK